MYIAFGSLLHNVIQCTCMILCLVLRSSKFHFSYLPDCPSGGPNLHVADIKPPGQIRTVEVEVEPLPEDKHDKEEEREAEGGGGEVAATAEIAASTAAVVEKDGKDEQPGGIADVGEGKEEEPQSSLAPPTTPPSHPPEVTTSTTTTIPPDDTQAPPSPMSSQALSTVPPPLDMQAPPPSGRVARNERPETFGLDHPSPITHLPPLMSPTDDMSGQRSPGSGRKKSKPKPLQVAH